MRKVPPMRTMRRIGGILVKPCASKFSQREGSAKSTAANRATFPTISQLQVAYPKKCHRT
jgi:hypothetical protein